MGLPPLEYSDCFLDSPSFREIIALYEQELENNAKVVKSLVKECDNMIQKTEEYSRSQQDFARSLSQFRFQTIGTEQTEDELQIADSLKSFAQLFLTIEDYRKRMLKAIEQRLLKTLENFRREHIKKTIEDKKKFDESSKKYYSFLSGYLGTKVKKKDQGAGIGSTTEKKDYFEIEKAAFRQVSFDYVCHLQDVHAQKHYELIEPILGYVSDVTTFLHLAYEEACSLKPQIEAIQVKVQLLRETNEQEQEKAYELKAKVIEDGLQGLVHHPDFLKQGHVMILERRSGLTGHHWQRFFCQFQKRESDKLVKFLPLSSRNASVPLEEWMEVKDCVRTKGDDVDRRFCFDLTCNKGGNQITTTIQALSDEDRRAWLLVMEGREPVYYSLRALDATKITPSGYKFIEKCITTLEDRGLEEEGLYRRPGTLAKANRLVKDAIEKNMVKTLDLRDEIEWDTKTLASAIKAYFSKQLGEPVMTFHLHPQFIEASKLNDMDKRIEGIKELVEQLPSSNRDVLVLLIAHLKNVAKMSDRNLMKPSNLGVCFGPTLMRPEHETVASIVDIRYQNIIVETLIQHYDKIFPDGTSKRPFPQTPDESEPSGETPTQKPPPPSIPMSKRRTPPAAPTKRVSAVDFMQQRRTQTFTSSEPSAPVTPITSNKDIPPPAAIAGQRPNRYTTPSARPTPHHPPTGNRPHTVFEESGKFDHLESRPPSSNKPTPLKQKPVLTSKTSLGKVTPPSNTSPAHTASNQLTTPSSTSSSSSSVTDSNKTAAGKKQQQQQQQLDNRRSPPQPPAKPTSPKSSSSNVKIRNARTLYECEAEDDCELSFKENEILTDVTESEEPDWLLATTSSGKRGLVPANYVELL